MTNPARFYLTRATAADLPEMITLMYHCFDPLVREKFMGCKTEADIPKAVGHYEEEFNTDRHAIWIKVVDKSTGKIAAATLWNVYPNLGAPPSPAGDMHPPSWIEGETLEQAKALTGAMNEARRKANPEGFVRAEYRRKGLGNMMLEWGTGLADWLQLPSWVEASVQGNFLYKLHGFVDVEKGPEVVYMRREAKQLLREY